MTTPWALDLYDNQNGSVQMTWGNYPAGTYNVYVNGVLNQSVIGRQATVSGLTIESYNNAAVVASSGNSLRPQNMPPKGQVTPSGTYLLEVRAVISGVEVATVSKTITISPTSIMLTTPMRRPWPFPNSSGEGGGYGG